MADDVALMDAEGAEPHRDFPHNVAISFQVYCWYLLIGPRLLHGLVECGPITEPGGRLFEDCKNSSGCHGQWGTASPHLGSFQS